MLGNVGPIPMHRRRSGIALNVLEILRNIEAASPEVMKSLFERRRDIAHLPLLIFLCDGRESLSSPVAHDDSFLARVLALIFLYSISFVTCVIHTVTIKPSGKGGALVIFHCRREFHMYHYTYVARPQYK